MVLESLSIETAFIGFIIGIFVLYKGSDFLVDGTAKAAVKLGVSPLIISLTVVAYGTSAPEFAISFGSALQSYQDIAVGNVIGSCVANLLLVLGISAVIRPIKVRKSIVKREMTIMLCATLLFVIFSYIGFLDANHWIGAMVFLLLFILYLLFFIQIAKREYDNREIFEPDSSNGIHKNMFFIIFGIIGVVAGAHLLIESAKSIAVFFGISRMMIALSMIAIGTSLPELAVSIMAAYKKESDIAVGNIIGSNVFNIFLILGACALIIPLDTAGSLIHMFFLLLISIIFIPIFYMKPVISRKEGMLFLVTYSFYIWYIFFI
ncbi:MAG: sodium:calcium antiporter [Thermoplasmata archaeon]|nr:MAG: sodium:calcium antiporter [Thermoplasmata archaeon]